MTPPAIIGRAIAVGLDAIGVADHNSSENARALRQAGLGEGVPVFVGMEVTSKEEVHVLVFFDDIDPLMELQEKVYGTLHGENDPAYFGQQQVVDSDGRRIGTVHRLLIGRTELPIGEIVDAVHERGGMAIGSHVDRPSYSVVSQLGFIPEDLDLDAVELSPRFRAGQDAEEALRKSGAGRLPWVTFSDAHALGDIGACSTVFTVQRPVVDEITRALRGEGGRSFRTVGTLAAPRSIGNTPQ